MGFLKFMRYILFILCILSLSCKYNVSDPLMPLKDYTAGKGITYYISSSASVSEIEDTLKKNKHSLGKYKLVVNEGDSNSAILTNIKQALDKNPNFDNVEIDITQTKIEEIPESIFKGANKISSITLPNTVTNIQSNAFSDCSSLNNIRFSSELLNINEGAFSNCTSLKTVLLDSEKLTNIGSNAFYGCSSLVNLILGKNVSNMNCTTFSNCNSLKNVEYIGNDTEKNNITCSPFSGNGAANPTNLYLPNINTTTKAKSSTSSSFLGKTSWIEHKGESIPL